MRRKIKHVWRKWPFKHTTALTITIALLIIFLDSALMSAFFEYTKELGYIGALIAGVLFVSLFTTAASVIMLYELGQVYSLWWVTLIATLGAVLGDFLILRFFEDRLLKEFSLVFRKLGIARVLRTLRRKRYRGLLMIAGFGVIASPLPDELGLGMLDVTKMNKFKILSLCFIADLTGVFLVVFAGYLVRPGV